MGAVVNDSPVDCQSRDCLTSVARGDRVLRPDALAGADELSPSVLRRLLV